MPDDAALRLDWMDLYWACRVAFVGHPEVRLATIVPPAWMLSQRACRPAGEWTQVRAEGPCGCVMSGWISREAMILDRPGAIAVVARNLADAWEAAHNLTVAASKIPVPALNFLTPDAPSSGRSSRADDMMPWQNATWN